MLWLSQHRQALDWQNVVKCPRKRARGDATSYKHGTGDAV